MGHCGCESAKLKDAGCVGPTRFKKQVLPESSYVTDMKVTGFSDFIDLLGHGLGRIEINSQAFYIRTYIQTAQASDK